MFYLTSLSDAALATWFNHVTTAWSTSAVRRARGRLGRTTHAFWDEVGAALQFPYYFTAGWPGFSECLRDLAWLPAASYLLVVGDAPLLFADEEDAPTEWAMLVEVIARAHARWDGRQAGPDSAPGPKPFHALLQCKDGSIGAMARRIEAAGGTVGHWSAGADVRPPGR